ncbi:MAG: cupin domain-containing protein, partial [Opitutae bacterium]|nr:cupin domain-containing protein [Opitutae bacterium]
MNYRFPVLPRALIISLLVAVVPTALFASEQLFLIRHTPTVWKKPDDLTRATETALYKPLFGQGDKQADLLNGVIRFGELTVEAQGRSSVVSYPSEEQIYYILEGEGKLIYGDEQFPVRQNDFMYLPIGVKHGVINNSNLPIRLLVMGYSVPSDVEVQQIEELQI